MTHNAGSKALASFLQTIGTMGKPVMSNKSMKAPKIPTSKILEVIFWVVLLESSYLHG